MSKIKNTLLTSLSYLGAAICEGQQLRGVQRGPQLIRQSGVLQLLQKQGLRIQDEGDISVCDINPQEYPMVECPVRNLHILGPLLNLLNRRATEIISRPKHEFLLTVGGDHSVGAATVAALNNRYSDLKVVWVDAHPDCSNTMLRSTGKISYENYHGMPLSHLTGITTLPPLPYFQWINKKKLNPKNVVLIAIRDIDSDEYVSLAQAGVRCYTMDHVEQYGIGQVMRSTIQYLDPENRCPFHLSFDIDGVDPDLVSQTGTRFRYGLSGRESVHIVRRLAHERRLVSMDLVQINESVNEKEEKRRKYRGEDELKEVSHTVGLGVDLITSLTTKYLTL